MQQNVSSNNKRIAKNTLLLYVRMFFIMATQLYTSRVILNTLGVEDYGIYNVVGGVIAMLGFLNGAMSLATQRYLTFELGKGNLLCQIKVFNTSVQIHALIALIVFILAETIGVWFLYNKMIIPFERLGAAMWVFQCAILSSMVVVMSVPFNASIIAHEKMSAFAYISVIEVVLKLAIAYVLVVFDVDKLKLYACLILCVHILIIWIYNRYCIKRFEECKFKKIFHKHLFKEMLAFAGWNVIGNCAYLLLSHGLNILLNVFFGPIVNAARAIAVQVESAIQQFSNNFQMAINPQITKTYAQGDLQAMHKLIFRSSRFTFLLLFILSLPVMIEVSVILELWLKQVPDHAGNFFIIMMTTMIVDSMAKPFGIAAAATGEVKKYQTIVGGALLSIVPIAYVVLKLGGSPENVFFVHLAVVIATFFVRLLMIKSMIRLSIFEFFKEVLSRATIIATICVTLALFTKYLLPKTIIGSVIVCLLSFLFALIFSFTLGLTKNEKLLIFSRVKSVINKFNSKQQ